MRALIKLQLFAALALASLVACGSNSAPGPDAGPDGGPDAGHDAGPSWSAPVTIDGSPDAGFDLTYAVDPSGHPAIAYFRNSIVTQLADGGAVPDGGLLPDGGTATEYGINQDTLVLARETSPGVWVTENVPAAADGGLLTGHYGVGLAFDPNGNPALAYMGGDPGDNQPPDDERWHDFLTGVPLPSDSVMARKSGSTWTRYVLGTVSDSYVHTLPDTISASDNNGEVIGLWSAIAFDSGGTAHVVQRDVHFGAAMSDFDNSNLEYGQFDSQGNKLVGECITSTKTGNPPPCVYPPSSANPAPGCVIHGGGAYSHMFLVDGQPVVGFAQATDTTSEANGAWFVTRTAANMYTRAQVSATTGRPGHAPSLAYLAGTGFAMGILDASQGDLLVATSADGLSWNVNTVEALGETGYHPGVAFGYAGLGVLYGYCHSPTENGNLANGCSSSTQELRFRLPGSTGPTGAWLAPEHVDSAVPDGAMLIADGNGDYVAVWRDAALGVRASRRSR